MKLPLCRLVWIDGSYVPLEQATIPITTHAMHYGTTIFEGVRAYWNGENLNVFRLDDHIRRFRRSGGFYGISLNHTDSEVSDAITGICRENKLRESCYVRPFYFVGNHGINLHVTPDAPTVMAAFAFPFGDLFEKGGISAVTSSWRKFSDASTPVQAKMGGNYLNSIIATGEAKKAGADEAILLDLSGNVSEAPGENIFAVIDGRLVTPTLASSALEGITRNTILEVARAAGIEAVEQDMTRAEMMSAQEVFLSGTAAEITPVTIIDSKRIGGGGGPGPVTREMMERYTDIVMGRAPEYADRWLTPVYGA